MGKIQRVSSWTTDMHTLFHQIVIASPHTIAFTCSETINPITATLAGNPLVQIAVVLIKGTATFFFEGRKLGRPSISLLQASNSGLVHLDFCFRMLKLNFGLILAGASLAIPLEERQAPGPIATIENGLVVGTTSRGIDSFSGIPFAQPPVGDLRLRAPQPYNAPFPGCTYAAIKAAPACPQFAFQVDNVDTNNIPGSVLSDVLGELSNSTLGAVVSNQNEDCLYLTVQRPAGTTAEDKHPVLFYIFGGAFSAGSSGTYDGGNIIRTSAELG